MTAAKDPHAALRAAFPTEAIGKLPKSTCRACSQSPRKRCDQHRWVANCRECHGGHTEATMHLDYVGHADVTDRLLQVDPAWTWEPMALDPEGLPARDRDGNLWIRLTVLGVTRPGVGDGKSAKECISDAIRNGAMRFGVALDLWAKGDRTWATTGDQTPDEPPAPQGQRLTATPTQRRPAPAPAEDAAPVLEPDVAEQWLSAVQHAADVDALRAVYDNAKKGGQLKALVPDEHGEGRPLSQVISNRKAVLERGAAA